MAKDSTTNTDARKNLSKQIGAKKLKQLETLFMSEPIVQEKTIDTKARKDLLKKIGKKELANIESLLLRGEI
jgi:hypothetical protein